MGLSPNSLDKYLKGISVPSIDQAEKICQALDSTLSSVFSKHTELDCLDNARRLIKSAGKSPDDVRELLTFLFAEEKK